jgi:hypothetical protein
MKSFRSSYGAACAALIFAVALVGVFRAPSALAGNREMVEERTEELEEINLKAVKQIPEELPEEGAIELEAEVVGGEEKTEVEIKDYSIRRGQIPRKNQTQTGNESAKAKGSIPRYDPTKQ